MSAPRMLPGPACAIMLRSRRAWFRRQSLALYGRYVQVVIVLLALFGVALVERPALLAEPILHFWRAPGSLAANAGWAAAWLALVGVWVRIHRGFIAGGPLAAFTRSLPLAVAAAPLVDAAMLLTSLQVFLVPAGLAAWTAATGEGGEGGAGGWFALRAALLLVLSLGVAQWAAVGTGRATLALLGAGFLVLAGLGHYGAFEPALLALAALLAGAAVLRDMLRAPAPVAAGRASVATGPRLAGMCFLLSLQLRLLGRRHLHAALPRVGLAIAVQAASLWMIFGVGKLAESSAFVKVGCWLTVAILSGFFHLFWTARQPLQPFVRSLPHGPLRMALSEQLLLLGTAVVIFAGAYGACLLQPGLGGAVAAHVLRHGAASLLALPLLGLPLIQRHQDGVLLKVPILVLSFLLL